MKPGQDRISTNMLKHPYEIYLNYMGNKSPNWEWYGVFNPYIVIGDHGYDSNHVNGIRDLTDKWIGVRQLFL